jgi:hypothetical protein
MALAVTAFWVVAPALARIGNEAPDPGRAPVEVERPVQVFDAWPGLADDADR